EQDPASIEEQLTEIIKEKEAAAEREEYEQAANLRYQEIQLQKQLEKVADKTEEVSNLVTIHDVEEIVEEKTGIPVTKLQEDEQDKMRHLANQLRGKVIGQDLAVDQLAQAIRRSRAGLKAKTRPIGSFLFIGPTGVGKTELSKVLAEELFGKRDALIRLDMSEY